MVGFHATRKKARVVSRAEGAVKQNRLCVEGRSWASCLSAKTSQAERKIADHLGRLRASPLWPFFIWDTKPRVIEQE
jgi:hypothetical protein